MNREQKAEIIETLTQKLNECNFIYLTDVSSLDAQKTSDLRRAFFKEGVVMEVAKNTLIEKAIEKSMEDTVTYIREGKVIDHEDETQTVLPGVKSDVTILEGSV